MLGEPHGLYLFPPTRPTTPSQSSGPSYGPAQVLMDDNHDIHGPRVRRPSRGGSQVGTPNADSQDMAIQPANMQGFPVDSVCALSRVMSPNDPSTTILATANESLLLGMQCLCQACGQLQVDPAICAQCGVYGHPVCIGIEHFQGYAFCRGCMGDIVTHYALIQDANLRREWQLALASQVVSWKDRARDAIGASASIGIAVGGAAATAAGAAYALTQGIVQGVSSAASRGAQASILPPPMPDPSHTRPLAIRRANSTGDLEAMEVKSCPRCDMNAGKHTFSGTCKGLPQSVYFLPKGAKRNPDKSSASIDGNPRREEDQARSSDGNGLSAEENL